MHQLQEHVLIFRCIAKESAVIVIVSADTLDTTQDYIHLESKNKQEFWLGLVDTASPVGTPVQHESISREVSVALYSLCTSFYGKTNPSGGASIFRVEAAAWNVELHY